MFNVPFLIFRLSKELFSSFKLGTIGETTAEFELPDYFLFLGLWSDV